MNPEGGFADGSLFFFDWINESINQVYAKKIWQSTYGFVRVTVPQHGL